MSEYVAKLIIIGSGPAGYSAGIYAARAGLEPIIISGYDIGGQLTMTASVENFPGFIEPVSGTDLMEKMRTQALNFGVQIINDRVTEVDLSARPFVLSTENGNCCKTQSLIVATGASAKWLNIKTEKQYIGKGISTCATCDGFFYKNQPIAIVGGGNSAAIEALYLTRFAGKVYLIHRRDALRADSILQQRLLQNPKIEIVWNSVIEEFIGGQNITGIKIKNVLTDERKTLDISGVFLAIGHTPNTELFKKYLTLDDDGYILTKPKSTATNIEGVFAAGDVQDNAFRQAVIAVGSGAMAAIEAGRFLAAQDN